MEFLTRNPIIFMGWIVLGAMAVAFARRIMGSKDVPFVNDVILWLIGSIIGGFVVALLGITRPDIGLERIIINSVLSVTGAVIIIELGRLKRGHREN